MKMSFKERCVLVFFIFFCIFTIGGVSAGIFFNLVSSPQKYEAYQLHEQQQYRMMHPNVQ